MMKVFISSTQAVVTTVWFSGKKLSSVNMFQFMSIFFSVFGQAEGFYRKQGSYIFKYSYIH